MSKASELLKDEKSGGSVVPEHLTLKGILSDIGAELKHQAEAGAHEMAKAILSGQDAFVLYGREGKEQDNNPGHGLAPEAGKDAQQKEMDGPEM